MSLKSYAYIGPLGLIPQPENLPARWQISSAEDLKAWLQMRRHERLSDDTVPATYIVDLECRLWIADRRSEHVACARGGPVLMAGELFLADSSHEAWVEGISNQSTGYCPAADYAIMAAVLDAAQILHPGNFEPACEFRICAECSQINLIKDGDYSCGVCGQMI